MRKSAIYLVCAIAMSGLVGCTTVNDPGASGAAVSDGGRHQGVETSGLGSEDNFGSSLGGRKTCTLKVENQTYYFDYDNSTLHADDSASVDVQAHYLAGHPGARVRIEGHTDPRGSREYNIALGERRAKSVADMLKSEGATSDQVKVVSYGAEKLATPGHTEEDYEMDRRVNLVYEAK